MFSKSDEKKGGKREKEKDEKKKQAFVFFFSIIKPFMKKMIILNDRGISEHSPDTSCIGTGNAIRSVNPTLADRGSKVMQRDGTTL